MKLKINPWVSKKREKNKEMSEAHRKMINLSSNIYAITVPEGEEGTENKDIWRNKYQIFKIWWKV